MKRIFLLAAILLMAATAQAQNPATSEEYKQGMALLAEERYTEAISAFDKAIAKDPKSDLAYIGRGDAYTALEKASEALGDYKKALSIRKSEAAYIGSVNAQILSKDFDGALRTAKDGSGAVVSKALKEKMSALEKGNATDTKNREHMKTYYDNSGKKVWVHITDYDTGGRIASKTAYDGSGNQTGKYEYTYDANGNNLKSAWYVYNRGILMPSERTYDAGNRVVEIINHGIGNMGTNRSLNEYGADGRKSKETYWPNITRDEYYVSTYEWTDFGKVKESRRYDKNEKLESSYVNEYDAAQQMIKTTYYKADGSVNFYYVNEFDATGKKIREHRYDGKNQLVGTTEY